MRRYRLADGIPLDEMYEFQQACASAVLKSDTHTGSIHQHERRVKIGVRGDGLDIVGVGRRHVHVIRDGPGLQDEPAAAVP